MAKPLAKAFDWPFNHIWQADAKEKLKIDIPDTVFLIFININSINVFIGNCKKLYIQQMAYDIKKW